MMRTLAWIFVIVVFLLLFAGCSYRTTEGPPESDLARVVETTRSKSQIVPSYGQGGVSFGATPEQYLVAYRWRGEKRAVDSRLLWLSVDTGDSLRVWWHAVYHTDKKTGIVTRMPDHVDSVGLR